MSLRITLLVTCAVIATTASVRSQDVAPPAPAAVSPPADAADALRAAGLGDLAPTAPVALELSEIPAQPAMAATPAAAPEPAKLDLSALWYFATQKDFGRVAAEIKLIRKTHPDWTPPADLFSAADGGGPEEQPLWDLFAKGDFDGVHAGIDTLKGERPDWTPSANLQGKLALAEARVGLMKASDAKDWAGVIAIATANKMLLTCRDLESLWRTAEALGRSGDETRATETYRYALSTCTSPHDRLATVQKASTVLQSAANLDKLLQLGRKQADGSSEFQLLRLDRIRAIVGEATSDRTSAAPAQADIDALATVAKTPAGRNDAQLLGWYSYSRKDYPAALTWFKQAMNTGQDPKAAEGLTLSLRASHDPVGARKAALQYAPLGADNRRLMVDIMTTTLADPNAGPVSGDELAALGSAVDELKSQDGAQALALYADGKKDKAALAAWSGKQVQWKGEEIEAVKSAEGAEALGWQLYLNKDLPGAETWFQKSSDWAPSEAAAVGLVLTAHRLHHAQDYASRVTQFRTLFPRVAELEASLKARGPQAGRVHLAARPSTHIARGSGNWDRHDDEIIKTFHSGKYEQAVAMLDQRRSTRSEPRGLTVVRGWALYHKGDWAGAERVFSGLDGGQYSDERAVGLRVIETGYTNPRYR